MKTVYFIRHGLAIHNVRDPSTGQVPPNHERFTDAPLIARGEIQARALREKLKRMSIIIDDDSNDAMGTGSNCNTKQPIDLVVCSPLMRCLQTASHIFPNFSPVYCHGDLREAYGIRYSDRRGPMSTLKAHFPCVVYHHPSLSTDDDVDWQPHIRETRNDVIRRVDNFLSWLTQQPQESIAVVSHGVWIECALLKYCPSVLEFGKKRVHNCDVYCVNVTFDRDELALTNAEQIA